MTASEYIGELFSPEDWIAIVLISRVNKDHVIQRTGYAGELAKDKWQAFFRHANCLPEADRPSTLLDRPYDVFVSMNRLHPHTRGRTKEHIAEVKHVFLDIDKDGRQNLEKLFKHPAMEKPNYVLESSPGKFQPIWKVQEFTPEKAETLCRNMVQEFGGDPAAVDISRVMRLPGFTNRKYENAPRVRIERYHAQVLAPEAFPREMFQIGRERQHVPGERQKRPRKEPGELTQSERDWAYINRHLRQEHSPAEIIEAVGKYRTERGDKADPYRYAERTVLKAMRIMKAEREMEYNL